MTFLKISSFILILTLASCSSKPSSPELIGAVNRSDHAAAEKVLSEGANPDSIASGGNQTALLTAITRMDVQMVNILLKYKASTEAMSENSFSPLTWTASSGSETGRKIIIIRNLVKAGADINKKTFFGNTTLHNLVNENVHNIPVIEEAIRLGADPTIKNEKGATAIDAAIEKNIPADTIEYMKNAAINKGKSPPKFGNTEGMCKVIAVGKNSNLDGMEGFFFNHQKPACDGNGLGTGVTGVYTSTEGKECNGTWSKGVLKNPSCTDHM